MNEIILAPCDVISKSKQNSSDMNEIILAPCDAGYVQSCTGLLSSATSSGLRSSSRHFLLQKLPALVPKQMLGRIAARHEIVHPLLISPFTKVAVVRDSHKLFFESDGRI
jgi:hypothetical protein